MEKVLLRKLADKSVLWFGKYQDMSVRQILDLNGMDGMTYLVWLYYNNSEISFVDSILEELKITGDLLLNKPEKSPQKIKMWYAINKTEEMAFNGDATRKRINKIKIFKNERYNNSRANSDRLYNHGHRKH